MYTLQQTYIEGDKNGNAAAKEVATTHNIHFTGFSNGEWRIGEVNSSLAQPLMNEVQQATAKQVWMKIVQWTFIVGFPPEYEAALEVAQAQGITIRDGLWRLGPIVSSSMVEPLFKEIQQIKSRITNP